MRFQIREASGERGPWKVSTKAYYYAIQNDKGEEILSYHWHPNVPPRYAHMHLSQGSKVIGGLRKAHFPTRRICLEEVLRFLVEELKVTPLKSNWDKILRDTQNKHEAFRTWS